MKVLLALCVSMFSLQVVAGVDRNFVGSGVLTSSGEELQFNSKIHLGWNSGIALDYLLFFVNGNDVLHLQMIVQPFSNGSCNVLDMEKKLIGECEEDSENEGAMIVSYQQDDETTVLAIVFDFDNSAIEVTSAKITAADGTIVTWQDKLTEV